MKKRKQVGGGVSASMPENKRAHAAAAGGGVCLTNEDIQVSLETLKEAGINFVGSQEREEGLEAMTARAPALAVRQLLGLGAYLDSARFPLREGSALVVAQHAENHWSGVVVYGAAGKKLSYDVFHFDSLRYSNGFAFHRKEVERTLHLLHYCGVLRSTIPCVTQTPREFPEQPNDSSCGVFLKGVIIGVRCSMRDDPHHRGILPKYMKQIQNMKTVIEIREASK